MVLRQLKPQLHAVGSIQWLVEREDGLSRNIAAARTNLDAPSGEFVAIVCILDGAGDPPLITAIIKNLFEFARRRIHVRRSVFEFQLDRLSRAVERYRFDF